MSGNSDKAAGVANEAIGKATQSIGSAVGSDRLTSKGADQELRGGIQKASGDAKNVVKDVDKAADALKKSL